MCVYMLLHWGFRVLCGVWILYKAKAWQGAGSVLVGFEYQEGRYFYYAAVRLTGVGDLVPPPCPCACGGGAC